MTNIYPYENINVELLYFTNDAAELLLTAANITMKQEISNIGDINKISKLLIKRNHTSLFEHINYTFLITGASRSFLSQITRHRMASYTSGSQHYQLYHDYDFNIDSILCDDDRIKEHINNGLYLYDQLIKDGYPREEARQILPNGMQNNLMMTINARSLINFFNLRLCNRNTKEMRIVAQKMFLLCYSQHPYIWENIGPDCYMSKCKQDTMSCKKPLINIEDILGGIKYD